MGASRFFRDDISASLRSRLQSASRLLGLTVVLLLLAGCSTLGAPFTPYRTALLPPQGEEPVCLLGEQEKCADQVYYTLSKEKPDEVNAVHMAFVEFDDQGYLQADKLTDDVLGRIKTLAQTKPVLMMVYAHGWKHNAKASDTDVNAFSAMLLQQAKWDHDACKLVNSACHNREVVGVYLGWRGAATEVEPFKELSFWQRKSRAHRVGIDGASQIVSRLGAIKVASNEAGGNKHTKLILTGHSFGAALMYSATEHLLLRDLAYVKEGKPVAGDTADLVVLVNPAFEAARAHALKLEASKHVFPERQGPILAVFTSTADDATGYLFPLGRGLSTLWMHHAPKHDDTAIASAADQRAENTTTIGKYGLWQTHKLKIADAAKPAAKLATVQPTVQIEVSLHKAACKWRDFQKDNGDEEWSLGDITLLRDKRIKEAGKRRNPYLFVTVDGEIIPGHSEIWGPNFSEFLYRFVAVQGLAANEELICP